MELYEFDKSIRNGRIICGVDEAGRGPLAGDVYAAAVIFDEDTVIEGINDSKKLSEKKREVLFDKIIEKAKAYFIAKSTIEEIEKLNILNAAMLAMKRAIEGLEIKPQLALIDGNKSPDIDIPAETVVKGDAKSQSIAAASILAKVARDRYMKELDKKYPQYQFSKHNGYGTKLHYEMLEKYGISPVHRPYFLRKFLEKNEKQRDR